MFHKGKVLPAEALSWVNDTIMHLKVVFIKDNFIWYSNLFSCRCLVCGTESGIGFFMFS